MPAGPPNRHIDHPEAVRRLARGGQVRVVWENALGGLTFEVIPDTRESAPNVRACFVKWAPVNSPVDLNAEALRLEWAHPFTPVPRLLDQGHDEEGSWLVTAPIPGQSAVSDRWKERPARAAASIGEGLRAFHESLPVDRCPFSWSVEDRTDDAKRRASLGLLSPLTWHVRHQHLNVEQALSLLADIPPIDTDVVCQGDACAPNTILDDRGQCSGHVDLGALGIADRWADLAIATWSTVWNYGVCWEASLLDAYGVAADPDRTRYYRLLWDVGP